MTVYLAIEYDGERKMFHGVFSTYVKAYNYLYDKGAYDFDVIPCVIDKPIDDELGE